MNNYYQILGVNKNATNQEIEYQYTILIKDYIWLSNRL